MTKPTDKQVRREALRMFGKLWPICVKLYIESQFDLLCVVDQEGWMDIARESLRLKSTVRTLRKELKQCQVNLANMPTRIEH